MSTIDVEKGQPEGPEQEVTNEAMTRSRRFKIGIAVWFLIAIALIVGLSVGLTRPSSSSSSASTQNQSNGTSTGDSSSPPVVQFTSTGRAFNVTMNLLSPSVLEGYDNEGELKADLDQAIRFYINTFIEEQILYGRMSTIDEPQFSDDSVESSPAGASGGAASAAGKTDYNTNNQNEGVDEADYIKSDGIHVFAAYDDVVVVWEAATGKFVTNYTLPALEPSSDNIFGFVEGDKASNTSASDSTFVPWVPKAWIARMSLEDGKLILFVSGYGPEVVKKKNITSSCYDAFATRIMVFDASKPLVLITQEDVQGTFQDARAIGNNIHVVTNCGFNLWTLTESAAFWNDEFVNMTDSQYRTAAAKKVEPLIEPFVELMVADINAHGIAKIPKISLWGSRFGNNTAAVERANSGGAIQAFTSLISFSVANLEGDLQLSSAGACTPSSWGYTYSVDGWIVIATQGWEWNEELGGTGQSTHLLGFSVNGISASPALLGSFPGYITSQYALSIYDGYLRVATTIETWFSDLPTVIEPANSTNTTSSGNGTTTTPVSVSWPEPLTTVKNQVIILKIPAADGDVLEEVSRISDLGEEGERITAINYFGPIAYAVTFLQTDPFYVLDLNPSKPAVLGELKITGFSSYLHSINDDNTLLVSVGEEADINGTILGLKVALFDASDPKSPQLLHSATVETDKDAWSSSDATYDFKAFRWLSLGEETGVVILPVRVQSWSQNATGNFDGFFVYDVSREGISLRLNISHVASEDFFGCYSSAQLPQRSMVFNGNVTTTKGHSVVSTDLDTGKRMWKLDLPKPSNTDYCVAW